VVFVDVNLQVGYPRFVGYRKKPLLQCLLVSFLTSTALSLSFRFGFQLIMPGVN